MSESFTARASIDIMASPSIVWRALTDPAMIKQYMFGTNVTSNWTEGTAITWEGVWQGKSYQDKGTVLQSTPPKLLRFNHFSPLSGLADTPENYHTVTVELAGDEERTRVSLSQSNNSTDEDREHSQKNWQSMLGAMKALVEKHPSA